MDAVVYEKAGQDEPALRATWQMSVELIAYLILAIFVVLMFLAETDITPLQDAEAIRAVSTWHILSATAPGSAHNPDSPIVFWLQGIAFSLLGPTAFAARLPGLVAVVLLCLSPLWFRRWLGPTRTLALALLLACSPFIVVGARTADPALWTAFFALASLAALWRHLALRRRADVMLATFFGSALVFLAGPGAPLWALCWGLAGLGALWWSVIAAPDELDAPGTEVLERASGWWRTLPWPNMVGWGVGVVLLGATGFFFYPAGLGHISQMLMQTMTPETTVSPLFTLFVYDPMILILGLIALFVLVREGRLTYPDRFAALATGGGILLALLMPGLGPGSALLIALPLMWLTSSLVVRLLANLPVAVFWLDTFVEEDGELYSLRYGWVKWALGLGVLALLLLLNLHWHEVAREMMRVPVTMGVDGWTMLLTSPELIQFRYSAIWTAIGLMFLAVVFFLCASVWGNRTTLQGYGLGLLVFGLVSGFGGGWNATTWRATNALEAWYTATPAGGVAQLRATLYEIAQRDTKGFPVFSLVVADPTGALLNDPQILWTLRDFPNAILSSSIADAARQQVVILPADITEPELGGSYVGQRFALRHRWAGEDLASWDVLSWFALRRARTNPVEQTVVILWLRQDVFEGIPPETRP